MQSISIAVNFDVLEHLRLGVLAYCETFTVNPFHLQL